VAYISDLRRVSEVSDVNTDWTETERDKEGTVLDGNTYAHYGITGGKLDDYAGRNLAEVRYPLEYPRKDFDGR
jgi:hypothetical protein